MTGSEGNAQIYSIDTVTLVQLPKAVSQALPSRGIAMARGTIGAAPFHAACEPDGRGSHWIKLTDDILKETGAAVGDVVTIRLAPTDDWLEPDMPSDLRAALDDTPPAAEAWDDITTIARWDWIRWISATRVPITRQKRIDTACDMLANGKRRPCCFNRSQCTVTMVSKSGKLIEPDALPVG